MFTAFQSPPLSHRELDLNRFHVARTFLSHNDLADVQLDSFNAFIQHGLRRVIAQNSEIVGKLHPTLNVPYYYIRFGEVTVDRYPHLGDNRRLMPHECEFRSMHYTIPVLIDVEVWRLKVDETPAAANVVLDERGDPEPDVEADEAVPEPEQRTFRIENVRDLYMEPILRRVPLYEQPVLVRSIVCSTNGLSEAELIQANEDPNDRGGYFIVNGSRKAITAQERTSFNMPFTYVNAKRPLSPYTEVRCPASVHNRMSIMQVGLNKHGHLCVTQSTMPERTMIAMGVYYKAMGLIDEHDILRTILLSDDPERNEQLRLLVESTLDQTRKVRTSAQAKRYLTTKRGGTTTADEFLHREFLSKFTVASSGCSFEELMLKKATFLGYCVYRCLAVKLGWHAEDDRDSFAKKCIDTVEVLLLNRFYQGWTRFRGDCARACDKAITRLSNFNPLNKLDSNMLTAHMLFPLSTGNWGNKINVQKTGVSSQFEFYNYQGMVANLRRTAAALAAEGQVNKPRHLGASHYGRLCPSETPEGQNIGFIKNLALGCYVTVGEDAGVVAELLRGMAARGELDMQIFGVGATEETGSVSLDTVLNARVHVNGDLLGFTAQPVELLQHLRRMRRSGNLGPEISLVYDDVMRDVIITTDVGRLCTPHFIVQSGSVDITADDMDNIRQGNVHFTQLLERGVMELLDAREWEYANVVSYAEDIKYNPADPAQNTTHVELDPALIYGVGATKVVYPDHNQAPRNSYQAAMGRQAMGVPGLNFQCRHIPSKILVMDYPQAPLTYNRYDRLLLKSFDLPQGQNAITAVMPYYGLNQEDSIILNKASVDRGFGMGHVVHPFRHMINIQEGFITAVPHAGVKNFADKYTKRGIDLSGLDEDGVARIGHRLRKGDPVIGLLHTDSSGVVTDHTVFFNVSEHEGVVWQVIAGADGECYRFIEVLVMCTRRPEEGDKFASRHGQKGTVGRVVPQEDMPHTADGITPDVILNPLAFTSRMTVGHLIETIAGKAALVRVDPELLAMPLVPDSEEPESGVRVQPTEGVRMHPADLATLRDTIRHLEATAPHTLNGTTEPSLDDMRDATPFNRHWNLEYFMMALLQAGYDPTGNEALYSGITGELIEHSVFFGITYYQRLKHMVVDKVHARARGPQTAMWRQPSEGRVNQGAMRVGEMERDGILSNGASGLAQDRLMDNSDRFDMPVCTTCGGIAMDNKESGDKWCAACKHNRVVPVTVPYPSKVLVQTMAAMGIAMRLIPEKE